MINRRTLTVATQPIERCLANSYYCNRSDPFGTVSLSVSMSVHVVTREENQMNINSAPRPEQHHGYTCSHYGISSGFLGGDSDSLDSSCEGNNLYMFADTANYRQTTAWRSRSTGRRTSVLAFHPGRGAAEWASGRITRDVESWRGDHRPPRSISSVCASKHVDTACSHARFPFRVVLMRTFALVPCCCCPPHEHAVARPQGLTCGYTRVVSYMYLRTITPSVNGVLPPPSCAGAKRRSEGCWKDYRVSPTTPRTWSPPNTTYFQQRLVFFKSTKSYLKYFLTL